MNRSYDDKDIGLEMWEWANELFPINRSITGPGLRESFTFLKTLVPQLKICSIKTGTKVYDWTIPQEWEVVEAWVKDKKGKKVIDFDNNNLHLIGYSTSYSGNISKKELLEHLWFRKDLPNAIPYVTSYYKKRWGFCVSYNQLSNLKDDKYFVKIDTKFKNGVLNYGEIFIPGRTKNEILFSSYLCHPSMANNELSGPVVLVALARYIASFNRKTKFSYRFVITPETIGSIAYISRNIGHLKKKVFAAFNLTCIGDDREYSFLPSRQGSTLSDKVAKAALYQFDKKFKSYTWLDRGSDERQYCSPGVDIPMASIMRTKYGEYPEYHTSLDDLEKVVTPSGLLGGYNVVKLVINILESNCFPITNVFCEAKLSERGLYNDISAYKTQSFNGSITSRDYINFLSYCDGKHDLIDISLSINLEISKVLSIYKTLLSEKLIENK